MKVEWDFKELENFAKNLGNHGKFNKHAKRIAREISKALLNRMKSLTPVEDGDLIRGWDGNHFLVTTVSNGYEVAIVNTDPKGTWVNDGHKAYNQFGGPYEIKRRVKVKTPYTWQKGNQTYYVFGHFFVERGILELENSSEIETIVMKELVKWWDSV